MKSMKTWRQRCAVAIGLTFALVLTITPAAADPPATSGVVVRGNFESAAWWTDPREEVLIIIGVDIVDFCNGIGGFDTFSFQDAVLRNRINTIQKGDDIRTSVWPFTTFDCFLFLNTDPLATGTTKVVWPDNDLFAEGDQANAFGLTARGFLTTPDGEKARVSAHWLATIDAHGGSHLTQRIILR